MAVIVLFWNIFPVILCTRLQSILLVPIFLLVDQIYRIIKIIIEIFKCQIVYLVSDHWDDSLNIKFFLLLYKLLFTNYRRRVTVIFLYEKRSMNELMVVPAMMPTRSRVARKGKQTPYFFSDSKFISRGCAKALTSLMTELKLVILLLPFLC